MPRRKSSSTSKASASKSTPPKQKKGKAKPKSRWWRRLFWALCWFGLVAAIIAAGYMIYIDRTITATFEGRRWSVPAVVYAEPLELYPGANLSANGLVTELKRIGYQRNTKIDKPGTYHHAGPTVRVHLRPFYFMERPRQARAVTLKFKGERIQSIEADGPISLIRLEPVSIGSFFPSHGEDRVILTPEEIPDLLRQGLISVEDRKFESHPGFDAMGIARAVWVNLRAGELQQGGSTLTQQLVKSYFLDNRRTLERKLKELFMSVVLDARYSKEEILNAYINEIYLGQDGDRAVHGFGLGAQFYFNKRLNDLNTAEIATLISVIRGPSFYNPRRHPARAKERRNLVLKIFSEHGLIDTSEYQQLRQTPMLVTATRGGSYYPAFMDLVRQTLAEEFEKADLESEGLRIFTTLNPRLQDATADALDSTVVRLEKDRNLPNDKLQGAAIVTRAQTGDVLALVGGRSNATGFNRALSARRPVGSLIKPAVYLTALQHERYHLGTVVNDEPVSLELDDKSLWEPHNFDNQAHGPLPMVQALARSLNLATVHIGLDVGVESIAENIGSLLSTEPPVAYPSLLLGALELTPLEVARLYGHFASGGFSTPPKAVIAVLNEHGAPLTRYPLDVTQSLTPDLAAQVRSALTVAMRRGTGSSSPHARSGTAGKTGTSNSYRDSWFAGFDDAHLSVIWMGRDDNQPVGLTGSSGPLKVWDKLMNQIGVVPLATFGEGLSTVEIDYATGYEARASCAETVKILIPENVTLPITPGCGIDSPFDDDNSFGGRIKEWFRN